MEIWQIGAIVFTKPLCTHESKSGRNNEEIHQTKKILVIGHNSFPEMFEIVIIYKYHMTKKSVLHTFAACRRCRLKVIQWFHVLQWFWESS